MPTFNSTNGNDLQDTGFDTLYGGDGNDRLKSHLAGLIYVDGGRGDDFIGLGSAANAAALAHFYGGDGNNSLFGHLLDDILHGGEGNDYLAGASPLIVDITRQFDPSTGKDVLDGGGGTDALYGFDDNDVLYGADGNDGGGSITTAGPNIWTDPTSLFTMPAGTLWRRRGGHTLRRRRQR